MPHLDAGYPVQSNEVKRDVEVKLMPGSGFHYHPPTPTWRQLYEQERAMIVGDKKKKKRSPRKGRLEEISVLYMNQSNRIVTRVRDTMTRKTFVLKKVVTPQGSKTPQQVLDQGEAELHEVKCMLELEHPNTVRVYEAWLDIERPGERSAWFQKWVDMQRDIGDKGYVHYMTSRQGTPSRIDDLAGMVFSVLYILMEDCLYGSLETLMEKNTQGLEGSMGRVLHKILVQSASAFAFLNANHRVHKDVKTMNIFLTKHLNVKVGDFGSTEVMVHGRTPALGDMTELFIAPEFFLGAQHINDKFDVFALGLVFLRLVSGSNIQVKTTKGYLGFGRAMAMFPDMRITDMDTYFSKNTALSFIIRHMLDRNPDARWSAEQVFDALILYQPDTLIDVQPQQYGAADAMCFPAPDAVDDYNVVYQLVGGLEEQPHTDYRSPCNYKDVLSTLLGYILFGGLIYLLILVSTDRINESNSKDRGFEWEDAATVVGISFAGSLVLSFLWILLFKLFHHAPTIIYFSVYTIVTAGTFWAGRFFQVENNEWTYAVLFYVYGGAKLFFLLTGYEWKLFRVQREMSVHVSKNLIFQYTAKAKNIALPVLIIAIVTLAVLAFGMLFFINEVTLLRLLYFIPLVWLITILRNTLHYAAGFVFHNEIQPTQHRFRHPTKVGFIQAITTKFAHIILASLLNVISPIWLFLLRFSAGLHILSKYIGCFCCYDQHPVPDAQPFPMRKGEDWGGVSDKKRLHQESSRPLRASSHSDGGDDAIDGGRGRVISSDSQGNGDRGYSNNHHNSHHSSSPLFEDDAEEAHVQQERSVVNMTTTTGHAAKDNNNSHTINISDGRQAGQDAGSHGLDGGVTSTHYRNSGAKKPVDNVAVATSAALSPMNPARQHTLTTSQRKAKDHGGDSGGDNELIVCWLHGCFTYPAMALEALANLFVRKCLKMIVTVMGYYSTGYMGATRWIEEKVTEESIVHLQFDETLNNLVTLLCFLSGIGAVFASIYFEEKAAFFGFVTAYSATRVCLESLSAAISSAWIASLSGDMRGSVFDSLLHESNKKIKSMMKSKRHVMR